MVAPIALSEGLKFFAGLWFFTRSIFQAVLVAIEDSTKNKDGTSRPLRGVGVQKMEPLPEKLPSAVEIKKALPKHCFQPKISTSMYYALKDALLVAALYVAIIHVEKIPNVWVQGIGMVLYWAIQGTIFTAIFVIGHDCGHESFSNCGLLNDFMGNIYHGFLMVPYYMWKLSHKNHHKNNANIDKDEVFYPVRKSEPCATNKTMYGFGLGAGFYGYLASGYSPRNVKHYTPFDPFFRNYVFPCVISLLVNIVWGLCLLQYARLYGFWALFNHWMVPTFVFGSYCVIITFLHHHEELVPWYGDQKWDFVRGQLSSIDRHYGIVHDVIHSIGTHQMHHMFTKIPHYHLEEATAHFRKAFPELVRVCDEPILPSFFRMFKKYDKQNVIEDDAQIHVYT